MAAPNNPQLLPKTTAKAQLTEDRVGTLVADQGTPFIQYNPVTTVVQQTVAGSYTWTCPSNVTVARIQVWGSGAGGNGGNSGAGGDGGGGGGYSEEPAYPVVPGTVYSYRVGDGGDGALTNAGNGSPGAASYFDLEGDAGGVFAYAGSFKSPAGGPPSAAPSNPNQTISHGGGAGGGGGSQSTGGCGGGSSASPTAGGSSGATSSSSTGGSGGAGGTDKGAGGAGGNSGANGTVGSSPGGGGGGVGASSVPAGLVILNYSPTSSATYYGSDAIGGNANNRRIDTGNTMWQGGTTSSGGSYIGTMKSMMILPSSVASDLAAVTISSVTLTMFNITSWQSTGMSVQLGYSAATTLPATFDGTTGVTAALTYNTPQGASHVQQASDALAAPLKAGTAKALVLGPGPAYDPTYYGSFSGAGQSSTPVLTVSGYTGTLPIISGDGADGEVRITYVTNGAAVAAMQAAQVTDDAGNVMAAGLTGQATSFKPGSNPATLETWTQGTLLNGWANQGGGLNNFQYKMTPIGVWIIGVLSPAAMTNTLFFTLPAAYQPNVACDCAIGYHTATPPTQGAFLRVSSNGNCAILNSTTGSGAICLNSIIPLDST